MARVSVYDTTLSSIADAIRTKNGLTTMYKPSEMPAAILAIAGSGSGGEVEPGDGGLVDLINNATTSLYIPASYADENGVLTIPEGAGRGANGEYLLEYLEVLEFGEGITKIVGPDYHTNGALGYVGNKAPNGCKVTFPSTLKEISGFMFNGFEPKDGILELPEGLEIVTGYCFMNMQDKKIIFPSTIKKIDDYAFEYSGNPIYFKGSEKPYIHDYSFYCGTQALTATQYIYVPWSESEGFPHALYRKVTYSYYERENLEITGNCDYRFANNGWNWLFEDYLVTTKDVTSTAYMFYNSDELEKIPFSINFSEGLDMISFQSMFQNCQNLKELPQINVVVPIPDSEWYYPNLNNTFNTCMQLKEIPDDYFKNIPNVSGFWESKEAIGAKGMHTGFSNMRSLRKLPSYLIPWMNFNNVNKSQWDTMYNQAVGYCYCLEEARFPVEPVEYTDNAFYDTFNQNYRLTHFTLETNEDGSPIAINWSNQCIDLSNRYIGYASWYGEIPGLSGITEDKWVYDDTTYQALKNDPDWFSDKQEYSRYNHDSAVETINSLPDVSSGSNNIIRFDGASGSATDGGAINTLTADEIAVATAKGWTVEIV